MRRNFLRPGFGSSAGCFSLRLPGEGGTPFAPAAWGGGTVSHPPAPAGLQQLRGDARLHAKERTGLRAYTARIRHVFRARTRRAYCASSGAQPARLARATGASCAHNRRVSRRAERRVSRHANGASTDARTSASSGAQTARLRGVRSVCFLNLSVWTLVWLLGDLQVGRRLRSITGYQP